MSSKLMRDYSSIVGLQLVTVHFLFLSVLKFRFRYLYERLRPFLLSVMKEERCVAPQNASDSVDGFLAMVDDIVVPILESPRSFPRC